MEDILYFKKEFDMNTDRIILIGTSLFTAVIGFAGAYFGCVDKHSYEQGKWVGYREGYKDGKRRALLKREIFIEE